MSIITKRGDDGMTDLMYGRRVAKTDPQVAAYGATDELNAALGLARVTAGNDRETVTTILATVQEGLITVMGELAVGGEDRSRYKQDGFTFTEDTMIDALTDRAKDIERECSIRFKGWAIPGSDNATLCSAHLDAARTICRRAERHVAALLENHVIPVDAVLRYLNRLSDLLWLLARHENLPEAQNT